MASNLKLFNQTITNERTQEYLKSVLGEKKQEFVNNVTALVANNEMLQACEPMTVMYAALKATALDLPLDPNLGFAYVIPYRDNKKGVTEAQFQIGWKGISQLAIRSNQFKTINVTDVREGELKSRDRRTGYVTIEWIEDDVEREKKAIIGYLGYFKLLNGYEKETYWSIAELEKHGLQFSQTYKKGYGVWKDNFHAMAKKTVIKLMLNKGDAPMSVQMQQAIKYDQSVILDEDGRHEYVDNKPKLSAAEQAAEFVEEAEVVDNNHEEAQRCASGDLFNTQA